MLDPKVMMSHLTTSRQWPLHTLLSSPVANFTIGIIGGLHRQPHILRHSYWGENALLTHLLTGPQVKPFGYLSVHPSTHLSVSQIKRTWDLLKSLFLLFGRIGLWMSPDVAIPRPPQSSLVGNPGNKAPNSHSFPLLPHCGCQLWDFHYICLYHN